MRIFLMIAVLIFSLEAKSLFSNDNQAESSKYIMELKNLIVATQKTRGLTLSYINGNSTALVLIHNYRDAMRKAIGNMESLPLSQDSVINLRASKVSSSLIALNSKALELSSNDAFNAYTENIAQALMLAQTVSKHGSADMNDFGKEVSAIMMETILPLSEWLGEQRAIGSGVAAKGKASKGLKVNMKVLLGKIERLNMTLQAQMKAVVRQKPDYYGTNINAKLEKADSAISKYVAFTKKEFFKSKITVSSDKYFKLATDTISTILVLFDMNNVAIIEDSKGWI